MKRQHLGQGLTAFLLLLAATVSAPVPASALPVFARKYGFDCTTCHSSFPRLNDLGWRYRQNGYQLPGLEGRERTVLQTQAPLAARTSAGYVSDTADRTPGSEDVRGFQVRGLDLLAGGLLARDAGFLLIVRPRLDGSRGVAAQPGAVESAAVVLSRLAGTHWLNLRVGRFEPGYVAFSTKRQLGLAPYEIDGYAAPGGVTFDENQEGLELTGQGGPLSYALGFVNGAPANRTEDIPADFYVRVAAVLGQGEGQTAGQRLGLIGYFGRSRTEPGAVPADPDRRSSQRFGADLSLNVAQLNLAAQYLVGRDDRRLWNLGDTVTYSGGFAELSWLALPALVGFARGDLVLAPSELDQDVWRLTGGVRYHLASNLALHLEYSHRRQQAAGDDAREDFVAALVDLGI